MTGDYNAWIGREDIAQDLVTPRLVQSWRATMDYEGLSICDLPLGMHWGLAPVITPNRELAADGHPHKGGFLPPIPLPRRMWAGGEVRFLGELREGEAVERRSHIAAIEHKSGRSGELWFVTVAHTWSNAGGIVIDERQDIVYRDAAVGPAPGPARTVSERGDHCLEIECSSASLFRFSALTFNSHRIHYDRTYAVEEEGYGGIVVHGPLQAVVLMNFARQVGGKGMPSVFSFRGVSPLLLGDPMTAHARHTASGLDLWMASADGVKTMTATAEWRP
ncbi:MaoC family dehydratase N-terminal domain-containing protein [Mesorhizobium sp. CAU 1732]|uniref:FAS1-like dehydratase domain-containing protein n=1 Tax=Mesorhizobium sp. CAU 1732 TaxID=3140358 RepID=UPI0032614E40